jgi:uncharacterized membrane protein
MEYIALVVSAALTIIFAALTLVFISAQEKDWLVIGICALTFYMWINVFINTLFEKAEY